MDWHSFSPLVFFLLFPIGFFSLLSSNNNDNRTIATARQLVLARRVVLGDDEEVVLKRSPDSGDDDDDDEEGSNERKEDDGWEGWDGVRVVSDFLTLVQYLFASLWYDVPIWHISLRSLSLYIL